jgi:hypothetical protein
MVLLQYSLLIQQQLAKISVATEATSAPPATPPQRPDAQILQPEIHIFPEIDISVEVKDRRTGDATIVQGRADWCFGYGSRRDPLGTLLAAVEAKTRDEYSKGEAQLLTYLAILWEKRRQMGKTNIAAQGFWTDGTQYTFMCITNSGVVEQSQRYSAMTDAGLKTVFNFIVTILEAAMVSTPNATPTKPGKQQEKEIQSYDSEVWQKVYLSYNAAKREMVVLDDSDQEMK